MKLARKLNRRSFLATITGAAVTGGTLTAFGREARALQVTDSDPGDPVGHGRGGGTGITDRDPSDPSGRGRGGSGSTTRTGITDSDPTDPGGNGRGGSAARSGCSDSDPTDRGGNGRNCGTNGSGTGDAGNGGNGSAYQTGRRERRYEVCWVDHPSRTNDDCNIQTYSEWAITWSDGRVDYDTAESAQRRAEMEARGYTARWHRMVVNEW